MTSIGCQASDAQNAEIDEHPISEILPQQDQHVDSDATHVLQAEVVGDEEQEAIEEQIYEEEHPLPVHHPLADTAPPVVPDQAADHHSHNDQPASSHHSTNADEQQDQDDPQFVKESQYNEHTIEDQRQAEINLPHHPSVDTQPRLVPEPHDESKVEQQQQQQQNGEEQDQDQQPQAVEPSEQSDDATTPDMQPVTSPEQPEQFDEPQQVEVVDDTQSPEELERFIKHTDEQLHIVLATLHAEGHLTPFMALAKELAVKYPQAKISFATFDVCCSASPRIASQALLQLTDAPNQSLHRSTAIRCSLPMRPSRATLGNMASRCFRLARCLGALTKTERWQQRYAPTQLELDVAVRERERADLSNELQDHGTIAIGEDGVPAQIL
jgi:hypothetical protein